MRHRVTVTELFNLEGKICLVTGATGHLGFAIASALAEAGACVIASSRNLTAAKQAARELPTHNPRQRHHAVVIDQLADESSIKRSFHHVLELAGRVDVLVNNAHEAIAADLTSVSADQFNRTLANATGYFLLARLLRDHAVDRRATANIILLASMYGLVASYPDSYVGICSASPAAYHTLKAGIIQMTRHLAVYWAKDRIRVNALSPGPFPSPKVDKRLCGRLRKRTPLGRVGQPHELKGAIVFLASNASSFMTGQNLVIDGGWTAW
jgi:gluconate 5-dehydrogenase